MQDSKRAIYDLICNMVITHIKSKCPSLPLKEIIFTNDIAGKILEINPNLKYNPLFNIEQYQNLSGNVQFLDDNSIAILFDEEFLSESMQKNFCWIEVIIHEATHACDYYSNLGIMGCDTLISMQKCKSFWLWSEFHAKYVGTKHMLNYVKFLPQDDQNAYFNDLKRRIETFKQSIFSFTNTDLIIYEWMHIMGEILAWEESENICIEFNSEQDLRPLLKNYTEEIDAVKLLNLGRVIEGVFR